jgi:DNA-binding NarL/FixJ family response regulator
MYERRSRVLLADDHPVVLACLRILLEREYEVVAAVPDGQELFAAATSLRPDLVITDVEMPGLDGIEATSRLQAALPGIKVLFLSIHAEPSCVQAAFAAGAWGYLLKTSVAEEIQRAVREVLADHFYVSPAVARGVIAGACHPESPPQAGTEAALTSREMEILLLVAEGLRNKQIAQRMCVEVATVRTHLSSLYKKLRLESRVDLALYGVQAGGAAN